MFLQVSDIFKYSSFSLYKDHPLGEFEVQNQGFPDVLSAKSLGHHTENPSSHTSAVADIQTTCDFFCARRTHPHTRGKSL
jgi:hypothetical protein